MSLVRNFVTVGMATAASRVTGFVRDILTAATLGTGPVADAFVVAFRLPNLFRRILAEGAFNSAFVPLFAKDLQANGREHARAFAADVLSVMFVVLVALSGVAMMAMPLLVWAIAPGFDDGTGKFADAVAFTRICFPYLVCMGLIALYGGILNSLGYFRAAAWAPVLLNIILSLALLLGGWLGYAGTREAGLILSWGVFVAGFAQLAVVVWGVHNQGMGLRIHRPRLTPEVKRMFALGVPGVIAGGITQINLLIGTIIASTVPSAVSWLYFADRIYQLPLGIVGVAMGVVLLPEIARQVQAGDAKVSFTQNRAFELALLLTLPAAAALAIMPQAIVAGLFERGAFTAADTHAVATALAVFALGLPGFVLVKVFSPGFFAREDTKTPMAVAIATVAVNVVLSLALFPYLGHVGIAAATSAAGWFNALTLWFLLRRRGHFAWDDLLTRRCLAIFAATAVMGAGLFLAVSALDVWFRAAASGTLRLGAVVFLSAAGVALYGVAVLLLGGADWKLVKEQLRKRRERKAAPPPPTD
jgi:putative peptidoglycan lipid II flippase